MRKQTHKPEDIVAEIGREYDRMATETVMAILAVLGTLAVIFYFFWEILA